MGTAAEGGAYGMAVLASFMKESCSLSEFLNEKVFFASNISTVSPQENGVKGFNDFMLRYKAGFEIQRAAISSLND